MMKLSGRMSLTPSHFSLTDIRKLVPRELGTDTILARPLPLVDPAPGHCGETHPVPDHDHDVLGELLVLLEEQSLVKLISARLGPVGGRLRLPVRGAFLSLEDVLRHLRMIMITKN